MSKNSFIYIFYKFYYISYEYPKKYNIYFVFHNPFSSFFRRVTCSTKEGIFIWYVFHCPDNCIQDRVNAESGGVFNLTYERQRRYEGAWHSEVCSLIPDCLFTEAEDETQAGEQIQKMRAQGELRPVSKENEKFLKELYQNERHLPMSVGYIKDGKTYVTVGPLRGKEAWIRKIDRHKRLAKLELPDEDDKTALYMGLEIIRKE